MFLFSYFSVANVKDEPPDMWDEEEQQQEEEEEKEDKEKLRRKDRDLEFLFQEVVRDSSMDDWLKKDLQSKKLDPKYKELLVSIMLYVVKIKKLKLKITVSEYFNVIFFHSGNVDELLNYC